MRVLLDWTYRKAIRPEGLPQLPRLGHVGDPREELPEARISAGAQVDEQGPTPAEEVVVWLDHLPAHPHAEGLRLRALNQAARELLLAQASDWAFIMKTGTMADYAHKRTRGHISRFSKLYEDILANRVEEKFLSEIEWRDRIFPWLDYRMYADDTPPVPSAPTDWVDA